ncbi:uncharacterized protein A1O9_08972 [Exophiala aquamarina CBS 119918]|uniref:Small-subunit processome Utp12 domain-containing protein n=1 Tax=Exophiala aquamarina CBS 119918 TaxID=1182545 RepID=A0A072P7S6_9EURO|nr:uncharacterized protein A1O9_08972 [Exophiala aquamarina CBS 119918]KEF55318.1 hypothetical protein A1O9_08972 [Exophiala aquamarina CBS 119918]
MSRKSSSTARPKVFSAAAPAAPSVTASTHKSSVLKSAFAPSQFQLHLFASVVQSFDSNQLRIHDTTTGRLRCQHDSGPGSRVTSLDWGYYGTTYQEQKQTPSKKKRKRHQDSSEAAVVAYGTSSSEICFFSPAEGKIVGTLAGAHERGIKDFKFSPSEYKEGWSIGEDGKLVQWDLTTSQITRTISLPDSAVAVLATPSVKPPHILCASSTPFAVTLGSLQDFHLDRYDSFKNNIHSLVRSEDRPTELTEYFLAADTERYINIYDIPHKRLVRTLVAGSGVVAVELSHGSKDFPSGSTQQILSAVTKDGKVELFIEPFEVAKQLNGDLKSSRKNLAKKASAHVQLVNTSSEENQVPIVAASLQGPDLIFVSSEGGVDLSFQKIRWRDEGNGELLFDGVKQVVKVSSASTLNTATLNGVKDMGKSLVDESRAVVVNGTAGGPHSDAIEISSSEEDNEEDSADEVDVKDMNSEADSGDGSDEEMADADRGEALEAEDEEMHDGAASEHESTAEEPTFGELLASKHPNTISIADNLTLPDTRISISGRDGVPIIPSGMSLGTVLTQSLRTNDQNLLEACLHTLDINIVKNTIQRLDSSLAGILLSKLAERLASRPGRYGHLITWVQWTCIAHGGAIAAQPDVAAKVRTLYQVLTQRSRTLDDLLLLKGKLDMLDAQLSFRKHLAAQRPPRRDGQDEPGMIYIEGDENWDSSSGDDLDEDVSRPVKKLANGRRQAKATKRGLEDLIGGDESSDVEEPLALENGDIDSDDEDEDEEDEEGFVINGQSHGLLDNEAEVSGAEVSDPDDEGDEGAESSSDEGSSADEEEDEDDEEDSEMDSFINDDSISFAEDEDDIHISGDEDVDIEDEDKGDAAPFTDPVVKPAKHQRRLQSSPAATKTSKDQMKSKSSRSS